MAERHLDLARQATDVFNRRDWEAFAALMDDEVIVESRLAPMEGGYRGHEGLRRWWDELLSALPDYTLETLDVRDVGEFTLTRGKGTGHGASSATPIVDPIWLPMHWRGGRVVWWRVCSTEEEALEAIAQRT